MYFFIENKFIAHITQLEQFSLSPLLSTPDNLPFFRLTPTLFLFRNKKASKRQQI